MKKGEVPFQEARKFPLSPGTMSERPCLEADTGRMQDGPEAVLSARSPVHSSRQPPPLMDGAGTPRMNLNSAKGGCARCIM